MKNNSFIKGILIGIFGGIITSLVIDLLIFYISNNRKVEQNDDNFAVVEGIYQTNETKRVVNPDSVNWFSNNSKFIWDGWKIK